MVGPRNPHYSRREKNGLEFLLRHVGGGNYSAAACNHRNENPLERMDSSTHTRRGMAGQFISLCRSGVGTTLSGLAANRNFCTQLSCSPSIRLAILHLVWAFT